MSAVNLIVYPNCSKGGVTSVIRGRAAAFPEQEFHAVFLNDKGGRNAFSDLPNVHVRVIRKDRIVNYLEFILDVNDYATAAFLSCAKLFNEVKIPKEVRVDYEFHSSDLKVIQKELDEIDLDRAERIVTPSAYMASQLQPMVSLQHQSKITVEPNLVDRSIFRKRESLEVVENARGIPLVWVGRFDKGKGYRYFLRMLRMLPDRYYGIIVASFEQGPERAAEFLGEAAFDRVDDRIELLLNQSQSEMARIYQNTAGSGGALVSTSLLESFGYTVAEAIACGLPVAAFELPALREQRATGVALQFADIGNVQELSEAVLNVTNAH